MLRGDEWVGAALPALVQRRVVGGSRGLSEKSRTVVAGARSTEAESVFGCIDSLRTFRSFHLLALPS